MSLQRAVVALLGMSVMAVAAADGAAIARKGAAAAVACQGCHGVAGEGVAQAGFPRLAGLGAVYLQRQLAAFADGSRVSPVMLPIAKALTKADQAAVAAYYAAMPYPAAPSAAAPARPAPPGSGAARTAAASDALPSNLGATLATRGRWSDQLPACEQCHGPGGTGVGAEFPALVGQSSAYLAAQLAAFKSGARPAGPLSLMAVVAKKLSAAEVTAVAEYYATLPARTNR
ncbi:c-type cytochrome [Piscinibacter sakaiensis]|uniref:c-type cytochrome n=1 Tax=Piscinibacter sakaiensis TaxID=1547922 RepID=UPI003AAFED9E